MGVKQFTGRSTINISGCPANHDWVVWAVVQLLTSTPVTLDEDGRPTALYSTGHTGTAEDPFIHNKCPRNPGVTGLPLATSFGQNGLCLRDLGCRGPNSKSRCEASWNGIGGHTAGQPHPGHWCIGVNAKCSGPKVR
jgi:Ni,Fe-hydrogenase I small subunit